MFKAILTSRTISAVFVGLFMAIIGVSIFFYVQNSFRLNMNYLRGDQWVWVKDVLMRQEAGEISFFRAMTYEYEILGHSHILQLLYFWFNAKFLDLNLHNDSFIGISSALGVFAIFLRYLWTQIDQKKAILFTGAVISTVLFSSANSSVFGWSVLQFQYIYLLITILYLYYFIDLMNGKIAFLLLACFSVILFADAIGFAAIAATLAYTSIAVIFDKLSLRRAAEYFLFIILVSVILYFVFKGGRVHTSSSFSDLAKFILVNPGEFVKSVMKSFSLMFVFTRTSDSAIILSFLKTYQLGIVLSSIWLIIAVYAFFKTKDKVKIAFPVLLVLTGMVFILGTLKSRALVLGSDAMLTPRYYTFYTLVGFGVIMIIARWALHNKNRISSTVAVVSGLLIIGINTYESWDLMKKIHYNEAYFRVRIDLIHTFSQNYSDEDKAKIIKVLRGPCRSDGCEAQIKYLQENKLNLFSETRTDTQ